MEGLDADAHMLAVARERLGDLPLHEGDMREFDLGRQFDAVICLFSAIGLSGRAGRATAASCGRRRKRRLGRDFEVPITGSLHPSQPSAGPERENGLSILELHYLLGSPEGVRYWAERHELGLFTDEEYAEAFRVAGLEAEHDPDGLIGRGLYLAKSPTSEG